MIDRRIRRLEKRPGFLACLRYRWRLWCRRCRRIWRNRLTEDYLGHLLRSRLTAPFDLDGFLREHPRPLVAFSVWVDGLERFFPGGRLCPLGADDEQTRQADLLVCWLHSALDRVAALARRTGQPLLLAEDAFLKSILTVVRPGPRRYQANVAVFFDDLGYHYAAARPSRLEVLLNSVDLEPAEIRRGAAIREKLVRNRLTKYNHQPPLEGELGRPGRKKVLVVDQSFGDASVAEGLASSRTFRLMLKTALKENPEADVIVKKHPDSIAQEAKSRRRRRSYFQGLRPEGRIFPLTVEANPYSVIDRVEAVYTVSSQMGLEALMAGKPVYVFGLPAWAGWGLTSDYLQCPRRTRARTLDELVYIIYVLYTRYVGPDGEAWQAEDAIDYLLELRKEYFTYRARQ